MVTGARTIRFPKPGATKEKEPVTMISAERMLVHYNQAHPELKKPAQRVTDKITQHTIREASAAGWAGATVVKDAITGHTSGMALLRQQKTTITSDAIDVEAVEVKPKKAIKKE